MFFNSVYIKMCCNIHNYTNLFAEAMRISPSTKFFVVTKNLSGHRLVKIFCWKFYTPSFGSHTKEKQFSFSPPQFSLHSNCGGGEIRTHGPRKESLVFKTSAFNHSATPPFHYVIFNFGFVPSRALPYSLLTFVRTSYFRW